MILNFAGTDTFGVQANDLVFDPGYIGLVLLDDHGLELTQPVPRDGDLLLSVFTDDRLLAFSIAAIGRHFGFDFVLLIAQMGIQFRLQLK